jgi:hypothetical protein
MPYHYHMDISCDYNHTTMGHSPLVGLALDGRGIYGVFESDNYEAPLDLDACGGHVGPVPGNESHGVSGGAVYHYHVQKKAPYTLVSEVAHIAYFIVNIHAETISIWFPGRLCI